MMKKADIVKVPFTLRLNPELNEKLIRESSSLGLSKAAYITMVLHKVLRQESCS